MAQEYILRLYDTDLLTFSLSERGIEGLKADIHKLTSQSAISSRWIWAWTMTDC